MKDTSSVRKVPDGKLVRVEVSFESTIKHVRITGDFFCFPDNIIPDIENSFKDVEVNFNKEKLLEKIDHILQRGELVGASARDIVDLVAEAVKK